MSVPLPQSWVSSWPLQVTKCATRATGGTDVEMSVAGYDLAPVHFEDYDADRDGFDGLRLRIESEMLDQVRRALRLAQ